MPTMSELENVWDDCDQKSEKIAAYDSLVSNMLPHILVKVAPNRKSCPQVARFRRDMTIITTN